MMVWGVTRTLGVLATIAAVFSNRANGQNTPTAPGSQLPVTDPTILTGGNNLNLNLPQGTDLNIPPTVLNTFISPSPDVQSITHLGSPPPATITGNVYTSSPTGFTISNPSNTDGILPTSGESPVTHTNQNPGAVSLTNYPSGSSVTIPTSPGGKLPIDNSPTTDTRSSTPNAATLNPLDPNKFRKLGDNPSNQYTDLAKAPKDPSNVRAA